MNEDGKVFETTASERSFLEKYATLRGKRNGIAVGLATVTDFMLESYSKINEISSSNTSLIHCASYNDLYFPTSHESAADDTIVRKSQSLPVWSECLRRSLSLGNDLDECFSKLHFTKKRRNRMGNDIAAAIALKKSQINSSKSSFEIEDQELLLDSDIVVVYDERTSL